MDPVTLGLGLGGAALGSGLFGGKPKKSNMQKIAEADAYKTASIKNQIFDNPLMMQGMTGLQNNAFDMVGNLGSISPAMQYFNQVLQGGYENPYAQRMFDSASSAVRQKLDSQFAKSGRLNSDAHANVAADAYNDLATNIFGNERQYIDSAARALPSVYNQGLQGASMMAGLGEQQRGLLEMMQNPQFYDAQRRLGALSVAPAPAYTPAPTGGNSGMGALGGAMGLLGFGKDMGWLGGGGGGGSGGAGAAMAGGTMMPGVGGLA